MSGGRYIVHSPQGGEILAEFRYSDCCDKADAEQRAKAARIQWKKYRDRVGIAHSTNRTAKVSP